MAISYPLTMPTTPKPDSIQYRYSTVNGMTISPFSLTEHTYDWNAAKLTAQVNLPKMTRANARAWIAFLMSLDGRVGTFYLTNFDYATPEGTPLGTPVIASISADGKTINSSGWDDGETGLLKAGDWIQLSSGQMVAVVEDADSDGAGVGLSSFEVRPPIRDITLTTGITTANTKGIFRLSNSEVSWTVDNLYHHGITLDCTEAIR